jgi:uncharacterized repeat protein (TIGR04052 family)
MRLLVLSAVALLGCGDPHPGGGEPVSFSLKFEARVGADSFACDQSYPGIGKSGTTFTPFDLRLYVHDVKLVHHAGEEVALELDQDGKWQYQNIALLDFENKTGTCTSGTADVNTTITGKAPAGTYSGVRFKVGVPFELNHKDIGSAPSPLNLSTMYWAWNGGYKFVRIEGKSTGLAFLQLHLGSTGCQGGMQVTSCARPNRPEVLLTGFDPATGTVTLDLAKLFADSDLDSNQMGTPAGCMSDAADTDCAGMFKSLGLKVPDGAPDPSTPQTLFR